MSTSSSLSRYRVASIQYEPMLGEKEKNVHDLLALVEEAARNDARLIVLPEMATTGYCWTSRSEIAPYTETIPGPTTDRFQALASRYNCYVAVSLPEVDPDTNVYYNSMALLGPEGFVGKYRKIHSYISEPRWARDGDLGIPVWDTALGRLSALICMDADYFESARLAALYGADVVILHTNWDDDQCAVSWWITRALENGIYLVVASRYGEERGMRFSGGSCILNPDGTIQSFLEQRGGIIYGEVDLTQSRNKQWGGSSLCSGNRLLDRLPKAYTELVNNTYLWEPLRYHSLYELGELPAGQLSCVGITQLDLELFASLSPADMLPTLRTMISTFIKDSSPATPDLLVLPELLFPGPFPLHLAPTQPVTAADLAQHFHQGAITVPGPETDALVTLAIELQLSIVVGVAERSQDAYYNTILLIDPEGIYGIYRKQHLTEAEQLWATPGNLGFSTFDIPSGRIGLATGYDLLFPETGRILASKGADLICAPALLDFPQPISLARAGRQCSWQAADEDGDANYLIWRIRAAEHHVYVALANWSGRYGSLHAHGQSGIYAPSSSPYVLTEVVAEADEVGLMMMTIDTREQRTGRRTTRMLDYAPGDLSGSLTGELAYDIRDSIPGNPVRSKPLLRKRQPYWYLDLVRTNVYVGQDN